MRMLPLVTHPILKDHESVEESITCIRTSWRSIQVGRKPPFEPYGFDVLVDLFFFHQPYNTSNNPLHINRLVRKDGFCSHRLTSSNSSVGNPEVWLSNHRAFRQQASSSRSIKGLCIGAKTFILITGVQSSAIDGKYVSVLEILRGKRLSPSHNLDTSIDTL